MQWNFFHRTGHRREHGGVTCNGQQCKGVARSTFNVVSEYAVHLDSHALPYGAHSLEGSLLRIPLCSVYRHLTPYIPQSRKLCSRFQLTSPEFPRAIPAWQCEVADEWLAAAYEPNCIRRSPCQHAHAAGVGCCSKLSSFRYKCHLTFPENISHDKKELFRLCGASRGT